MINKLNLRALYFNEDYSYLEEYVNEHIEPLIKEVANRQEEIITIPLCELNPTFKVKSIIRFFQDLGYNAFTSNYNVLVIKWLNND